MEEAELLYAKCKKEKGKVVYAVLTQGEVYGDDHFEPYIFETEDDANMYREIKKLKSGGRWYLREFILVKKE